MRRRKPVVRPAWTPEEDECLREAVRIGLCSDAWGAAFPGRTFGEIAERRLDLRISPAPLI